MKMRISSAFLLSSFLLLGGASVSATPPPALEVNATLVELPRTDPCERGRNRVVARYRLVNVIQGDSPGNPLYVVHRCPEHSRGSSRLGRGKAGPLRAGQTHHLTLEPISDREGLIDRFTDDDSPRFRARVTDPGPPLPQMVIKVEGGAGAATRITFHAHQVTIGRAMTSDVLLSDKAVALSHLRLEVQGDKVAVVNLSGRADTTINGAPISSPQKITYRDRITVGLYTVSVSLLLPKDDVEHEDQEDD